MNNHFFTTMMLIWHLVLIACSSHSDAHKIAGDNASTAIAHTDTLITPTDELTNIYSLAIADYIKAVHKEYNIQFDTLFFGKHVYGQPDDFPDITLPDIIAHTQIRLITPEVGSIKQKERKSLVYINLIGFVDPEKAEFIFVNFSHFGVHQYDCFINYRFNARLKAFGLEGVRFENYGYKKE